MNVVCVLSVRSVGVVLLQRLKLQKQKNEEKYKERNIQNRFTSLQDEIDSLKEDVSKLHSYMLVH